MDVGCFRGDFLSSLEPIWQKAGIEPSPSAAVEAQQRGIEVVGSEVEELKGAVRLYDVVTAIDVFEHLPFPTRALDLIVRVTKPGGRIIIVTGNSAALSWRLSGSSYWYCALRDHVSFFRPDWFRRMAAPLGFSVRSVRRCAHKPAGYGTRVDQAVKGCAFRFYGLAPSVLRRYPPLASIGDWHVPWWTSARDHFSIELERVST